MSLKCGYCKHWVKNDKEYSSLLGNRDVAPCIIIWNVLCKDSKDNGGTGWANVPFFEFESDCIIEPVIDKKYLN